MAKLCQSSYPASLGSKAWAWVCAAWAAVWTRLFSYLALAWLYVWTVLPVWKREKSLAEWVRRCVPSQPLEDLQQDLADGVVLCGLLEAVLPGACPRFDLLPKNNPETNLHIASRLAAAFLGVTEVTERGETERGGRKGGEEDEANWGKKKKHMT
ncbi:Filamin-C [Portunus trituberculatus]|uniref:Filamin-C n=1 Tax=Portunus trituberculatus TaxID=210409 RepID=A0A5B7IDR7_PORTR|nr:Filamin-C [Portunus trituberculatus]